MKRANLITLQSQRAGRIGTDRAFRGPQPQDDTVVLAAADAEGQGRRHRPQQGTGCIILNGSQHHTDCLSYLRGNVPSGRFKPRVPHGDPAGFSRQGLARGPVPVNARGRLANRVSRLFVGKFCRIAQKRLHLLIGFDDYPKANGTTRVSGRTGVATFVAAQVSETHQTDRGPGRMTRCVGRSAASKCFSQKQFQRHKRPRLPPRKKLGAGRNIAEGRTIVWLSLNISRRQIGE